MSALEHGLQCTLFHRTNQGIDLTEQGRVLLDRALSLAKDFEEIDAGFGTQGGLNPEGLRVGVLSGIRDLLLPTLLDEITAAADAEIGIVESSMTLLREQVRHGTLDFALLGDPSADGLLRFSPIWQERLMLVAPADHESQALRHLPFLMTSEDANVCALLRRVLATHGLEPRKFVRVTPSETGKRLIARGFGFSILHYSVVAQELSEGSLSAIPLKGASLRFGVVQRVDRSDRKEVEACIDRLRVSIQQRIDALPRSLITSWSSPLDPGIPDHRQADLPASIT